MAYHLRLEHAEFLLLEAIVALQTLAGALGIWHMSGKTGEHPHLHIWFPLEDNIQPEAFYNRLNKFHPVFKNFVGNKSKRVKPFDDINKFIGYCLNGNKGQKLAFNNTSIIVDFPKHELINQVKEEKTVNLATIKPQRKKAMKLQFVDYLKNEKNFKEGQTFDEDFTPSEIYSLVASHCIEFWKDAFTIPEGERMVRYAAFIFSNETVQETIKDYTKRNIVNRILGKNG